MSAVQDAAAGSHKEAVFIKGATGARARTRKEKTRAFPCVGMCATAIFAAASAHACADAVDSCAYTGLLLQLQLLG